MYISPINTKYFNTFYSKNSNKFSKEYNKEYNNRKNIPYNTSFKNKYHFTKRFSSIFGLSATLAAGFLSLIISGGLSTIPMILGYGALSALSGAVIGYSVDKFNRNK